MAEDPTNQYEGQPCPEPGCGQPLRRTTDGFYQCEGEPDHQWNAIWDRTGGLMGNLPGTGLIPRRPKS